MDYERSNQHLIFVIINKFKTIIMKTNRLLRIIVGCVLCAAVMQTTGCTGKEIPGDEKRDTTELFDTVLPFGVERVTISGNGGEMEVDFVPAGDWTFESETSWFKVVTASGTATDKVLRFSVESFDEALGERIAKTFITMSGVRKAVSFKQIGTPRSIVVYGAKVEFDETKGRMEISNIVSNVELTVVSTPTWISNSFVNQIKDSLYSVTLILNGDEIDTEARDGVVVLGDANFEEYTVDVPVSCVAAIVRRISIPSWDVNKVFPGEGTSDELDGTISVVTRPGAQMEDFRVFIFGTDKGAGDIKQVEWVTGIKDDDVRPIGTLAVYDSKSYDFHLAKWNDKSGDDLRTAYIMVVPESELMEHGSGKAKYLRPIALKPEYVVATINQERYEVYKVIYPKPAIAGNPRLTDITVPCKLNSDATVGASAPVDITFSIRMAKGYVPILKVEDSKEMPSNPSRVWDGKISMSYVEQGRHDLYSVTLHCNSVNYGASTQFKVLINESGREWFPGNPDSQLMEDSWVALIYDYIP